MKSSGGSWGSGVGVWRRSTPFGPSSSLRRAWRNGRAGSWPPGAGAVEEPTPWHGMSPDPALPDRGALLHWADAVAVSLLLMTTCFLILPAVSSSQLHSRVASCQSQLRQFGQALVQYSQHENSANHGIGKPWKADSGGHFRRRTDQEPFRLGHRSCPVSRSWLAVQKLICLSPQPRVATDALSNVSPAAAALVVDSPLVDLIRRNRPRRSQRPSWKCLHQLVWQFNCHPIAFRRFNCQPH